MTITSYIGYGLVIPDSFSDGKLPIARLIELLPPHKQEREKWTWGLDEQSLGNTETPDFNEFERLYSGESAWDLLRVACQNQGIGYAISGDNSMGVPCLWESSSAITFSGENVLPVSLDIEAQKKEKFDLIMNELFPRQKPRWIAFSASR